MKAGTRFSARVLIFSAISGLVLTNSYLLSAEDSSVQSSSNNKRSIKTVRNPQKTLINAIKREMSVARRISKPRTLVPQQEKRKSQIQQVGLTLDPRSLFQKRSPKPTPQSKKPEVVRGGKRSTTTAQYKTAVPQPNARPGQSAVQRQLEALYRRDGRAMPPMDLNSLPKTAGNQSAMGRGAVNPTTPPQTNSASQNVVGSPNQNRYQPRPAPKKKWYDKFLPAKTKQSPRRLPQSNQIVKKAPVAPPVTTQPENSALPELPPAPLPGAQSVVTGPEQSNDKTESTAKPLDELEVEVEELEIAADKKDSTETFVPEVKSAEVTPENVVKNDDFENLFPDMSEAAADNFNKPLEKEKEKEKSAETPFSGLVLEEESQKKENEKQAEPTKPLENSTPQVAQEDVKKEFNPFEPQSEAPVVESDTPVVETPVVEAPVVETPVVKTQVYSGKIVQSDEPPVAKIIEFDRRPTKRTSIKPKLEQILESEPVAPAPKIATSESEPTAPAPKVATGESEPVVPAPKIASSDRNNSVEKKLAIIASRGNIKGLKGFCPVALRENRLLVDARPEFSSSFKSMNYQFASLENKLRFDREPAKYAPAAGGSDIVLLVDHQDDKEGTLDFASWYKGKLYLFSNKTNMDLFMKTPALYVGVE